MSKRARNHLRVAKASKLRFSDDQHCFLLNYGRSTNKQSVVIRANLTGLEDEIAIISAREETLALLDQIRREVGDDPNVWIPLFHERRKNERSL